MRIELTKDYELTNEQEQALDLHSFNNLLCVFLGELNFLRKISGESKLAPDLWALGDNLDKILKERQFEELSQDSFQAAYDKAKVELESLWKLDFVKSEHKEFASQSVHALAKALEVARVRCGELARRNMKPEQWREHSISDLLQNLQQVFDSIAEFSHGRYNIVYNQADKKHPEDYVIEFDFSGHKEDVIKMPPVFQDCVRDLACNARKYTKPGGMIKVLLKEDGKDLFLSVKDNGRGVPREELSEIVKFGYRASNTTKDETKGGGFGLTKSYWICKTHEGRMCLESEEGGGFSVEIRIPLSD